MAHLKCTHERRVMVIRNATLDPVIRHRSDGGACNSRFVAIGEIVFEPAAHGALDTDVARRRDLSFGPLGPLVTTGKLDEAVARLTKPRRQVKKHRKTVTK